MMLDNLMDMAGAKTNKPNDFPTGPARYWLVFRCEKIRYLFN